ncbi:ABC transporter, ATP-binding protein (cluster 1, maltose/g3p/polyamine/iron); ABC transporter, ATP-binding protein (cluster 10, nitrate/sulfonate/bicarbonate) [hydrothermal vent metagenome]|uniref:ABC transporter, ATP-binding protein (Cluster 1, maltose/g3p/polyamine/iron) ABC transporter, ATP-binding protein (Cluster 10, nitrate/sulfonate/bicarbonate) n=1 Tax=hydrothermal vent metagenome TaxID=652676 RepID=A0A3B0TFS4_9ZZZZ
MLSGAFDNVAVHLDGVDKSFGSVVALDKLSIEVARGRLFVVFGPSSVGKTTLLRTISGLEQPDAGEVHLNGRNVTGAPIKGRNVSMVFQSFALYPHLTVRENFAYPLKEARVGGPEIAKRVGEIAEMLKLGHRLENKPATLSGGEQQRVALGRSLIRRPDILLLDEPLTNLDAKLRDDMRTEIKRLHRQFGITIIYATPDELEALSMGEEIAVMRDGAVVQTGSPDEVYLAPRDVYVAQKIGSPTMNIIDARLNAPGKELTVSFGKVPLPDLKTASGITDFKIGIRPADITITRTAGKGVKARVRHLEPLGDLTVVEVDAASDRIKIVVDEVDALTLEPGTELGIKFDRSDIHVFEAESGRHLV